MISAARAWTTAAVAAFAVLGFALAFPYVPERFSDFRAFYCAGAAVRAHADPYREHPLNDCERSVAAPGLSKLRNDVTVPVPFPGYVLALFALLAMLPFAWAFALWMVCASAALIAAIVLVARVTDMPPAAAAIVLGFPAVPVALSQGQVTPFVLLAIAASAMLLRAGRPRWSAFAALGAMLDPHVGLAVALGLAAGAPRSRAVLLAGIAGLAAIGLAASGPAHELEYLQQVLPAHALANVADSAQFSATHFAYLAGIPTAVAIALGSVWYVVALLIGTIVALRVRRRLSIAALVLVPPAFAVFGGTHTHLAQLAMAIPAFLLVCSTLRGTPRVAAAVITFVAAIPWVLIGPLPLLFPGTAVLAFAFARSMRIERQGLRLATASLAALAAIFIAIVNSHAVRPLVDVHVAGNPLAEASWQIAVLARNVPPESWSLFAKVPTVIAFLLLLGALVRAALRGRSSFREC